VKVFIYVQHLLGIGHLKRAATLARALRSAGFEVTLASGGAPVPGIEVHQLPSASSPDFRQLLDEHGKPVDDAWKERRTAALLDAWRRSHADALIVELFPFGRRQMRFELLPLLQEAKKGSGPFSRKRGQGPLVVCSVRDILQPNAAREAEALERFERYFDRLLVHGDPRVVPFERSFTSAHRIAERLFYTGYVVDALPTGGDAGSGEVLVSCGGGATGGKLLDTALAARPLTRLRDRPWRLLAGVNAAEARSRDGVVVERSRDDFALRLKNCLVSVSQAGYNTVMETLQAGARAVLVPFAAGIEAEQTIRANLLAERGLAHVVEEGALTPATLAAAIDRAVLAPRPAPHAIDLGGARRTAELMREWLK
jgi:predicted glycosyltransferase